MAEEGFLQGLLSQQLSPQGLVGGELSDIETRRKNRLALALESQKIELLMKQKEREQQIELAGNAAKLSQEERMRFTPPSDFEKAFGEVGEKAGVPMSGTTSYQDQQNRLGLVRGLPVAEFKGHFTSKQSEDPIGEGWARSLSDQIPGGLTETQIARIAKSPIRLAHTFTKMYIKDSKVQKEMADRVSGIEALPNLFKHLDTLSKPGWSKRVKLFVGQWGATSDNIFKQLAAEGASPGINQALRAATTMMQFGEGGKNLTEHEKKAVTGLIVSPAYGAEAVNTAKQVFVNTLRTRIKGVLKSGTVSDWRGVLERTNNALLDAGMDPIEIDDFSITEKGQGKPKSVKDMTDEELSKAFSGRKP